MAKHQIYSISLREIRKGVIINETRTDTVMYTRRQVLIKAERMGRNYFKIHPDSFYLDFNIYLEECQKPCLSVIIFTSLSMITILTLFVTIQTTGEKNHWGNPANSPKPAQNGEQSRSLDLKISSAVC